MTGALDELIGVAGDALVGERAGSEPFRLADLLGRRNGFYAFESALHVFGDRDTASSLGVLSWNDDRLWRGLYGPLVAGHLFFAEDIFGGQFSATDSGVFAWDPETGDAEFMAADLEGWARVVLDDYAAWTGHPVAHAWQLANGALPAGRRLLPVTPFILGGQYDTTNLRATDAVQAMRIRAGYAQELRELPDGARVRLTYGP